MGTACAAPGSGRRQFHPARLDQRSGDGGRVWHSLVRRRVHAVYAHQRRTAIGGAHTRRQSAAGPGAAMNDLGLYVLDADNHVVEAEDVYAWAQWFESIENRLGGLQRRSPARSKSAR